MNYYCELKESNFKIKSENFEKIVENLLDSKYTESVINRFPSFNREDVLMVLNHKDVQTDVLIQFFDVAGYDVCFKYIIDMVKAVQEDDGYDTNCDDTKNYDIIDISLHSNKWNEDTEFFSIFAKYIEKDSYLLYGGEENNFWRLSFNGETVIKENGKLVFESQELTVPYNDKASHYKNAFICPNCGAKLSYQNNFCHICGKRVKLESISFKMLKKALEKGIIKTFSAEAGYLAKIGEALFKIDDFEKTQDETLGILFGILEGYKISGGIYESDYIDCFKYIKNNGKVE